MKFDAAVAFSALRWNSREIVMVTYGPAPTSPSVMLPSGSPRSGRIRRST